MKLQITCYLISVLLLATIGATPLAAFDTIDQGVYRIDPQTIDDLLTITGRTDVNVLLLEEEKPKSISDVHMKLLRQWVESGGILWVAGDALEGSMAQTIVPFRVQSFDFVRSSSGKPGGELIVRGTSPRMTISEHPITAGVTQLYLFARSKFDGTERAEPLVEMGDSEGNSGWVLAAVPVGRGYVILDGTARKKHWMFGRLKGFDKDHPNSLEQEAGWNDYDWAMLRLNARDYARRTMTGSPGY